MRFVLAAALVTSCVALPHGAILHSLGPLEPARSRGTYQVPELCVSDEGLPAALNSTAEAVLRGLPPWDVAKGTSAPSARPTIAFLTQVAFAKQLGLVRRMFNHLYAPDNVFLYLVDEELLRIDLLRSFLPEPLPSNVHLQRAPHAEYFVWPRVQVVLDGLSTLLQHQWDFVVHLSESDYVLHTLDWIRDAVALQRETNFIEVIPRCESAAAGVETIRDSWFWWPESDAVASCGQSVNATRVIGASFPMKPMEARGFRFARGSEWAAMTRDLAQYAVAPELGQFRRLIGMHYAADEIFWATLVLNIPNFAQTVSQSPAWYIHWDVYKLGHSPDTLTEDDMQSIGLARNTCFFMRKLDAVTSSGLLLAIDDLLELPDGPPVFAAVTGAWDQRMMVCPADSWVRSLKDTFNLLKTRVVSFFQNRILSIFS